MTTMRAALDERFSDPGTQALLWADVEDVLTSAELFWVTTVRADDRPHQTPLVAVWLDGWLHFSTGSGEQKAYNLAHNDQVLLTTGCNTWDRGVDVVVEGSRRARRRPRTARTPRHRVGRQVGRPLALRGRRRRDSGTQQEARCGSTGSNPPKCSPSQKARSPTPATSQPTPDATASGMTISAAASANAGPCRTRTAHNSAPDHPLPTRPRAVGALRPVATPIRLDVANVASWLRSPAPKLHPPSSCRHLTCGFAWS
jgi:hypothetical protein